MDVIAIAPMSKSGEVFLSIKANKSAVKGISAILKSMKISARADEIEQLIDPATKQVFRRSEAESAAIVEESFAATLRPAYPNEAGDFIFSSGKNAGKSIDILGIPSSASNKVQMPQFLNSIKNHFNKSIDFVVIDFRNLNKEQRQQVNDFIDKNFKDQKSRLITIGND